MHSSSIYIYVFITYPCQHFGFKFSEAGSMWCLTSKGPIHVDSCAFSSSALLHLRDIFVTWRWRTWCAPIWKLPQFELLYLILDFFIKHGHLQVPQLLCRCVCGSKVSRCFKLNLLGVQSRSWVHGLRSSGGKGAQQFDMFNLLKMVFSFSGVLQWYLYVPNKMVACVTSSYKTLLNSCAYFRVVLAICALFTSRIVAENRHKELFLEPFF